MTSSPRARRVKIVCTLGPATSTAQQVETLVRAGMDVARLNLSHGSHEGHRQLCTYVRDAERATGRLVAVLADLQGPRIRLGVFRDGGAWLATGDDFVISTEAVLGSAARASTTYAQLACDVVAGDVILVDDGMVRLEVVTTNGREIRCRVVEGGLVADHKGVNLPGMHITAPAVTTKDVADLRFAARGRRRLGSAVVRSQRVGHRCRAAVMNEVGRSVPRSREAREAGSGRAARRGGRRLQRVARRPRGPRGRAPTPTGTSRAEEVDPGCARAIEASRGGDADAGVDDHAP